MDGVNATETGNDVSQPTLEFTPLVHTDKTAIQPHLCPSRFVEQDVFQLEVAMANVVLVAVVDG